MGTPQVTPIMERRHAWGFLVWDADNGMVSRGPLMLAEGFGILTAGLVLGQQTVGAAAIAPIGNNTGNPTFSAITVAAPAVEGEYVLQMVDATHFTLSDTGGGEIGHGVFGAAFSAGGIGLTATAGATPCVGGDSWAINVAAGSGQWAPYDPTKSDGTEVAGAILGSEFKDTTLAAQPAAGLIGGPARVNASELIWGPNVTTTPQQATALAQLQKLGIQNT